MNVEIYSKPGCTLCEEAKQLLLEAQKTIPFELHEVDIERDPALFARYKTEIPVVFVDGKQFFKHRVDREQLMKRLERSQSFAMGTLDPQKTLSRNAPVSRATKVAFALFALVMFGAIAASKLYQVFIEPQKLALAAIEVERMDVPAPAFEAKDRAGKTVTLADYKGKWVFLNYWATWCGPCREEIPSMMQLARTMDGDKFVMVAASVDDDWSAIDGFFGAQKPGFEVLHDEDARSARAFGTTKYPETYVIGPDGRVKAKFVGARDWSDKAFQLFFQKMLEGSSASAQNGPASSTGV